MKLLCNRSNGKSAPSTRSVVLLAFLISLSSQVGAFVIPQRIDRSRNVLRAFPDDEISRQLERAKELLAKSKAKLEAREAGDATEEQESGYFFASAAAIDSNTKREKVIKSRNEETGLITADGEKMAQLSEDEQWEQRSLLEVFENEMDESEDVNSLASKQLAERDVAASIYNLRLTMKTEDYRKIFDSRNRFIGEDN